MNILIVLRGPPEIFTHFIPLLPLLIVVSEPYLQYLVLDADNRCVVPYSIIRAIYDVPSLQCELPIPLTIWYLSLIWRYVPWIFLDGSSIYKNGYVPDNPITHPLHINHIRDIVDGDDLTSWPIYDLMLLIRLQGINFVSRLQLINEEGLCFTEFRFGCELQYFDVSLPYWGSRWQDFCLYNRIVQDQVWILAFRRPVRNPVDPPRSSNTTAPNIPARDLHSKYVWCWVPFGSPPIGTI